jgi:dienelactone hydrolase
MDWVTQGKDAGKFGKIDKDKIAAAGQSCGGIEALNVSNDRRVKLTAMFNSGLFSAGGDTLKNLNHPIAYFLGGKGDIAYKNVSLSRRDQVLRSVI